MPPLLIGLVLWTLARNVARAVYATPLSRPQRTALNQFIDKVQGLAEYRSLPPWLFGFVLAKDLVLHRDARSLRKIIDNSSTLRRDFQALNKLF